MISARITLAFDIYCKKKHRALELQRGVKSSSGDQEPWSCPQCTSKSPSQTRIISCSMTESGFIVQLIEHTEQAGAIFFHFQVLVNFSSWKTNHCVQSSGQGEEAVWDKPCLDPLLMLLGTSDMFLVLHPLYQPSQSQGQAQDEKQKKFCFKSYSLLRSWWCWSFRRWKSATAHSWDGTGGPHSMFCIDWCSNAWSPCGTDLEENSRLYPVGYRENWSIVI